MKRYELMPNEDLIKELQRRDLYEQELSAGLTAVSELIANSIGVAGLHLNGDVATWEELQEGGRFEEWLIDFDHAISH